MASCGPTNAQQRVKQFAERDATGHTEYVKQSLPLGRGIRSNPSPHEAAAMQEQINAFMAPQGPEFRFDRRSEFFGELSESPVPHGQQTRIPMPGPSTQFGQSSLAQPDWVNEFNNLSLSDGRNYGQPVINPSNRASGPSYYPNMARSSAPAYHNCTSYGMPISRQYIAPTLEPSQSGNHRSSQQRQTDAAFDAAFAEAEAALARSEARVRAETEAQAAKAKDTLEEKQRLESEKQAIRTKAERELVEHENIDLEREIEQDIYGEDASQLAGKIIYSIHESAPELGEKLQNSKFMNLMTKLSTSELKIGRDEFVSTTDEPQTFDWAPQRPTTVSKTPVQETETSSRERRKSELDDPETYLLKMRKNLDPRVFQKSQYTSPFAVGQSTALPSLQNSSWEENYEDW